MILKSELLWPAMARACCRAVILNYRVSAGTHRICPMESSIARCFMSTMLIFCRRAVLLDTVVKQIRYQTPHFVGLAVLKVCWQWRLRWTIWPTRQRSSHCCSESEISTDPDLAPLPISKTWAKLFCLIWCRSWSPEATTGLGVKTSRRTMRADQGGAKAYPLIR